MKVLNLQCQHAHSFEGWFASEDDFQGQLARGLVECPLCADKAIQKMPSAPRLNLSGSRELAVTHEPKQELVCTPAQDQRTQMQAAIEARSMHHGETPERAIRGQATREETQELLEEGIAVLPLPIPAALKEPLQ
jgi:hypothetical protein